MKFLVTVILLCFQLNVLSQNVYVDRTEVEISPWDYGHYACNNFDRTYTWGFPREIDMDDDAENTSDYYYEACMLPVNVASELPFPPEVYPQTYDRPAACSSGTDGDYPRWDEEKTKLAIGSRKYVEVTFPTTSNGVCSGESHHAYVGDKRRFIHCPIGYKWNYLAQACELKIWEDVSECETTTNNPIETGSGGKQNTISLDVAGDELNFDLTYRSNKAKRWSYDGELPDFYIGSGWTHTYMAKIGDSSFKDDNSADVYIHVTRGNGEIFVYKKSGSEWVSVQNRKDELIETATGWIIKTKNNTKEIYDTYGKLIEIINQAGQQITITYEFNPSNEIKQRVARVDGPFGNFIEFGYLFNRDLVTSVTDQSNRVWEFDYEQSSGDFAFILTEIIYPDSTSDEFHYEDNINPQALTGITDRRNVRYSTYQYDTQGRVIYETNHAKDLSENDINVNKLEIEYLPNDTRKLTNSLGRESTYELIKNNGVWQIDSIQGPGCSSCANDDTEFTYDSNNNRTSKTQDGVTTTYGGYDSKGQFAFKIEADEVGTGPDERRTDYTYDARFIGKITSITEPSVYGSGSKVTTYVYDANGQMTSMTVNGFEANGTAISKTTTYEYNGPFNQISKVDGPRPGAVDETVYTYHSPSNNHPHRSNRLKKITGPEGIVERNNIQWSATGKVTQEQRPNGITIINTYDLDTDRLVSVNQTDGVKSLVTQFTYLATGHVESVTSNYGTSEASMMTLTYDGALRVIGVTDQQENYIEYELDTEGNQTGEYTRDPNDVLKKQINQVFDTYDMLDTMTQSGVTVDYDYGSNGTLEQQTNGEGIKTDYSYDSLKRLTQITQDFQGSGSTANAITGFSYDAGERVETVTDARGNTTSYEYDDFGNLLKLTSPDTGVTNHAYDLAGNMTSKTDANGTTVTMTYDGRNRITGINYPDSALNTVYVYDQGTHSMGLLSSFTDQTGSTSFTYDAFGNQLNKDQMVTGFNPFNYTGYNPLTIDHQYDGYNRTQTMTYPSGLVLTYSYNDQNQIEKIETVVDGQAEVVVDQVQYLPFGPIESINFGNGKHYQANYDGGYRLQDYSYGLDINAVYAYDNNHNITAINREVPANTQTYSYDDLDRLTFDSNQSTTFSYDKLGNRTSIQEGVLPAVNYTIATSSNRLTKVGTGKSRGFDANGNTKSAADAGNYVWLYNDANRMTRFSIGQTIMGEYKYNGIGQRVHKKVGLNDYLYIYDEQGQLIHESKYGLPEVGPNNAHLWDRETIWLGNRPVARVETHYSGSSIASQEIYYIQADHLNTPRWITDDAGVRIWSWESDAFGTTLPNEDVDGDSTHFVFNMRFPGQYFDAESGMHYNYFRDYEPGTGRYLESDPIGLDGGFNTFNYVGSNPLKNYDLLGLATYIGFPPGKESEARKAAEEAIEKLESCKGKECSEISDKEKEKIIKKLKKARFVYVADLGYCGTANPLPFSKTIKVGGKAFDFRRCCDLSSTLAHEASHSGRGFNGGEKKARKLEEECFNCPRN